MIRHTQHLHLPTGPQIYGWACTKLLSLLASLQKILLPSSLFIHIQYVSQQRILYKQDPHLQLSQ